MQQLLAAAAGALLVGVLYVALPEDLSVGPKWDVLVIVGVLLAPSLIVGVVLRRALPIRIARRLAQAQIVVLTLALLSSLALLVHSLPTQHNQPARSAAASNYSLEHQYPRLHVLVLGAGWWRSARPC